jgi:predicted permease
VGQTIGMGGRLHLFGPVFHLVDELGDDLRFALRSLRKNILLSATVVITLGFALGLNTGVFTLIDASLFRPHVNKDPATFFRVHAFYSDGFVEGLISPSDYKAYLVGARSVRELAAWDDVWTTLGTRAPITIRIAMASCNFFSVYGLDRPELGRFFLPSECFVPGSGPVAVISDELWHSRFEARSPIVGQVIHVGRTALTIVGVTPPHFSGRDKHIEIWVPLTMLSKFESQPLLTVEGRLNPGYSQADVQAELSVIAQQQDSLHAGRRTTVIVTDGSMVSEPHLGMAIWVVSTIMGALALVLLISCANVSALLLSRATARQREIAIRLSLGAGRVRLMRMLLTEGVLLATVGGAVGAYLAWKVPGIIVGLVEFAPAYSLTPDWVVLGYLAAITLAVGCLAVLAPATESLRADVSASLKGRGGMFGQGVSNSRTLDFLIAGQIAMSLVLLAASAVCVRSQYTMFAAGPGFEIEHVLASWIGSTTDDWTFRHTLDERLKAIPGVVSVGFAEFMPMDKEDSQDVRVAGQATETRRVVATNSVSANFFETLRIPIVRGRAFEERDSAADHAAPVAIVSEAFARQFWPDEDPIGKVVEVPERLRVVGVSRNSRSARYGEQDGPQLFRLQNPKQASGSLLVRFQGKERDVARGIEEVLHDAGGDMGSEPETLKRIMDRSVSGFWAIAEMVLFLGISATVLALIGIYGAVAFAASRRTKEFGIRMALGAVRTDILDLVLRSGATPICNGLLVGICLTIGASYGLAKLMKNAPFVLNTYDPLVYFVVCLLLVLAATVAMLIPSLRATGVNPVHALREE